MVTTGNATTLYPNIGGDNLGNHTATTTLNMNNNWIQIKPNVTVDVGNVGLSWHGTDGATYGIYQEAGSWTSPHPDLRIAFHTGIKLGANPTYGGIRFYSDYDMSSLVMSVNDAATGGAGNVYIPGSVGIGVGSPSGKLHVNGGHVNLGGTGDPSGDQGNNWLTWGYRADGNPYYCIRTQYKTYGSHTYSRLQLNWHTGVEIGGNSSYGGTRFFNEAPGIGGTQIMSVGDGDNNIRVTNNLLVSGNVGINSATPSQKLDVNGTVEISGDVTVDAVKPFRIERYTLTGGTSNWDYNTGMPVATWTAVIAGFSQGTFDLQESGNQTQNSCYMYKSGGNWYIQLRAASHSSDHADWIVHVMFIKNEFTLDNR